MEGMRTEKAPCNMLGGVYGKLINKKFRESSYTKLNATALQ